MSKVYAEAKKVKRAAVEAKRAEKNSARQAKRAIEKNLGDISNDIDEVRNSLDALRSFSVTKTESMGVVTAVEEKIKVTFTHAIDDLVVCSSAPTEMSILHNIFLKKNGHI